MAPIVATRAGPVPPRFPPMPDWTDAIRFDADGLVPAVAQDAETGDVLMLAYMNAETLHRTLETGRMTYWSRTRQKTWEKGSTSGRHQIVQEIRLDCDGDALLFKVHQRGRAACHTGHRSCFYRVVRDGELVVEGRPLFDPAEIYGHQTE